MTKQRKVTIASRWSLETLQAWITECMRLLECYKRDAHATHSACGLCQIKDYISWTTDLQMNAQLPGSCGGVCVWQYFTGDTCTDYAQRLFESLGIDHDDVPDYRNEPEWSVWVAKRKRQLPQWIRVLKKLLKEREDDAYTA